MGLISSIVKYGSKALNYGVRAAKCAPEFIFGESASVIGKAYKAAPKGSIFSKAKVAGKAFESHVGKLAASKGGFFTRLFKTTVGLPKSLATSAKAGMRLAGMKGTSKFLGALKGLGKGFGKKMPYIGALLTLAFEAPNIYAGYKKEGIKGALKQTAGAGVELGCMAAGAAIGSCICPGIGSAIGGIIGGIVGWGARALTFPEPSEEEEQTEAEGSADADATDASDATSDQTTSGQMTSGSTSTSGSNGSTDTPTSGSTSTSGSNGSTDTSTSGLTSGSTPSTPSVPYPTTSMTNPFGTGFGMTYPMMNMGMGMNNPFGMYNPVTAIANSLLQPGENIFQKYPMGFQFQYVG